MQHTHHSHSATYHFYTHANFDSLAHIFLVFLEFILFSLVRDLLVHWLHTSSKVCHLVIPVRSVSSLGIMGRFKYFGAIVALTTILFVLFMATFCFLKKYTTFLKKSLTDGKSLENTGGVHALLKKEKYGIFSLCTLRFLFFVWFALFNTVYRMLFLHPRSWNYYTDWNIYLIGFYYTFALISTLLLIKKENFLLSARETIYAENISLVAGVLYTTAGSAALMITVLNFLLLNPDPTFWNLTLHLSTTLSLLLDMCLNDMTVNLQDLIFSVVWPFLYVSFIWPIVKEGVRGDWPYFFVETETLSCFFWYIFLFFISVVFFGIFYFSHRGKDKVVAIFHRNKVGAHEPLPENEVESKCRDACHPPQKLISNKTNKCSS